jgi:Ser/Thr protein kinase RdoA (MazF antagonist)
MVAWYASALQPVSCPQKMVCRWIFELKHQARILILLDLPRGIIHGDLFRDNIFCGMKA